MRYEGERILIKMEERFKRKEIGLIENWGGGEEDKGIGGYR